MNIPIEPYKERFNLKDAVFSPIEHEDALVAVVYQVVEPNGSQSILKICARAQDYYCEVYFLKYFANVLPVPRILSLSTPSEIPGAILMEHVSGNLLQAENIPQSLAYEMGVYLAKIHSHRTSGYGDLTQPQQLNLHPDSYFTYKFEEGLTECKNHLPENILEQCEDYYNKNYYLLSEVDGPCIAHRDFRPGNLIVCKDKIKGIIDWSSARGSFAEEDIYLLLAEWKAGDGSRKSFLAGYASIRTVPNYQRIMCLLRLSKAIATVGFTVKSKTWSNKNSALYQSHLRFLYVFLRSIS